MSDDITLQFSHPNTGTLNVQTGANLFSWAYKLNTQSFPTYGGEVVQILSAYIDNLSIEGDIGSYAKMEEIYSWFISYFAIATQGGNGISYVEDPVTLKYVERGWTMKIKPISLPNLHYGRDVVVPSWKIEAAVVEPDPEIGRLSEMAGQIDPKGEWGFGRLTADIGYRELNPFSDAHGVLGKDEAKVFSTDLVNSSTNFDASELIDNYNNLLANYENGDFSEGILRKMGNYDASMPVRRTAPGS